MNVLKDSRRLGRLFYLVYLAAFVAVSLLLCEGAASTIAAFRAAGPVQPVAEKLYCEYDPDLGWVSRPSLVIADMYGPGKRLATNAQRFRSEQEFDTRVPSGKLRLICSGDSFTFGYGVDNEETWSQRLAARDARIETVNMGQGGYGLDQAYLWYLRDGERLEHDIHVLAFVGDDFGRMESPSNFGYGKPALAIEGGKLVVRNVPVPRPSWYTNSRWFLSLTTGLGNLQTTALLHRLLPGARETGSGTTSERLHGVVAAILDDLAGRHREKGRLFVLVYLPGLQDYYFGTADYLTWRDWMEREAILRGAVFVDLVAEMRKLPPQTIPELFIHPGAVPYEGAEGHYSELGNRFVADALYTILGQEPRVTGLLSRR